MWILNIGSEILDIGYEILDIGYEILDIGYEILDNGYGKIGIFCVDLRCFEMRFILKDMT